MTQCRKCGAEIRFIKTVKGKYLPVDVQEHIYSTTEIGEETYITPDGVTHTGAKRVDSWQGGKPRYGYTPHWATCPYVDSFRKGGTKK